MFNDRSQHVQFEALNLKHSRANTSVALTGPNQLQLFAQFPICGAFLTCGYSQSSILDEDFP